MLSKKLLHNQIDQIDNNLFFLINKRIKILNILQKDKKKYFSNFSYETIDKLNISSEFIKKIVKYINCNLKLKKNNKKSFKQEYSKLKPIIIIGGKGEMGQLFKKMLVESGYIVKILDKNDWNKTNNIFYNVGMVIISVPIKNTQQVIFNLPKLPNKCILVDLTSIKINSLKSMLKVHSGPVVGLHPMFGPDVVNFKKQLIICCDGRYTQSYKWLINQLKSWGAQIFFINSKIHDKSMAIIQSLRYFISFTHGFFLKKKNINLNQIFNLSSPIYRFELSMIGRFFSQNPCLYNDIIMSSNYNIKIIKEYYECIGIIISFLENRDESLFMNNFNDISNWFGSFKKKLLNESRILLKK